jgi:hypothetical protein
MQNTLLKSTSAYLLHDLHGDLGGLPYVDAERQLHLAGDADLREERPPLRVHRRDTVSRVNRVQSDLAHTGKLSKERNIAATSVTTYGLAANLNLTLAMVARSICLSLASSFGPKLTAYFGWQPNITQMRGSPMKFSFSSS